MKLKQIQQEHASLVSELTTLGAGHSLVERFISPPDCRDSLERSEKEYGQERLRKLCVAIMARYLIILEVNPRFFDFVTANHVHRALSNNGINDKDIIYWMMFPRESYFGTCTKYPIPRDLQEEIESLKHRLNLG